MPIIPNYQRHKFVILGVIAFIHLLIALEIVQLSGSVPKAVNYIIIPGACLVPLAYKLATCVGLGNSQPVAFMVFAFIIALSTALWTTVAHQILSRLGK